MMLWRAAGKPAPEAGNCPFEDVPEDSLFRDAVMWATQKGIAGGASADSFGLNDICTRGQAITFLYRAAGAPEVDLAQEPFTDVEQGAFYYEPILWSYQKGICNGVSDTLFGIDTECTRMQMAEMLFNAFADK